MVDLAKLEALAREASKKPFPGGVFAVDVPAMCAFKRALEPVDVIALVAVARAASQLLQPNMEIGSWPAVAIRRDWLETLHNTLKEIE